MSRQEKVLYFVVIISYIPFKQIAPVAVYLGATHGPFETSTSCEHKAIAKNMKLALKPVEAAASKPALAELSEVELVGRAQQGEESAFEQLYKRYSRALYSLAYQMLGTHQDADEVLQETFVRVFKNLSRLRSPEAFTSWVYQITVNLCMDYRKMRARARWQPIADENNEAAATHFELATAKWVRNPQQVLENNELLAHITTAIDALPEQQKAVVIMHEIEGLSKKMISKVLECSLVTVRTNLHHARKKLRRRLTMYLKA